jgi:hypothetical protein
MILHQPRQQANGREKAFARAASSVTSPRKRGEVALAAREVIQLDRNVL